MSLPKLIEDCRYCHKNHNINNCFKLKRKNEKKRETEEHEKSKQKFPALCQVTSKKPPPQLEEQSYVDFEEAFLRHMEDDIRLDETLFQYYEKNMTSFEYIAYQQLLEQDEKDL
jgi:hypothetical protein